MTTQAEFFQAHAVNGVLPPELMAEMISLPEGDTAKLLAEGGVPDAASSKEVKTGTDVQGNGSQGADAKTGAADGGTQPDAKPAGDKPAGGAQGGQVDESQLNADNAVILAADGKHTISFDRLVSERQARQAAEAAKQAAEAEAARLRAELESAKANPGAGQLGAQGADGKAKPATGDKLVEVKLDLGDLSDEAVQKGLEKGVNEAVAQATAAAVEKALAPWKAEVEQLKGKLGEAEAKAQLTAQEKHLTAIYTAHPDANSIVESNEWNAYLKSRPSYVQQGIALALERGSAADIVKVFADYKEATGKAGAADDGKAKTDGDKPAEKVDPKAAAAAAQAAIASAGTKPPASLSDIPAGSAAHHDQAAALLEASSVQLLDQFLGKSPEQIRQMVERAI